jgi:8-oxo-dGTP pyrophosphatase MutT (NUDIX family)
MKHRNLKMAFAELIKGMYRRPPHLQVAALCLRTSSAGVEVLLVSSLTSKRWIIPKGWPMEGYSLAGAAQQEAWEEAGVRGEISEHALGHYHYRKIKREGLPMAFRVEVFRLDVIANETAFPEAGRRNSAWVSPTEAAKMVTEPELQALLRAV